LLKRQRTDVEGTRLGDILVREGLVTTERLEEALRLQAGLDEPTPLGQILIDQKLITPRQLDLVLDVYRKRPRLGEILVRSRLITAEQLEVAVDEHNRSGRPLGQVLLQLQYVAEEAMRQALCAQLNIPFIDLDQFTIEPALAQRINKMYARTHALVPIAAMQGTLTVAMDDPMASAVIEDLQSFTGLAINVVTSTTAKIQRAFARLYDEEPPAELAANDRVDLVTEESPAVHSRYVEQYRQTKKAEEIVRSLLNEAIERGASDIHIETLAQGMHVRFRIDGVLQDASLGGLGPAARTATREVVSRIKVLGAMDIAERRRPQDGSFRARLRRNGEPLNVDFRVSVIPGYYGESVVVRILDSRRAPRSVEQLGLSAPVTARLLDLLRRTAGIVLVTGPTGSGKSTTLYAALMSLYRPEIRILTAEDPIEYVYEHFSQSEVSERIGNTFATYMRSFLRHDPEVIMLGEIRDEETAEMAFRAAQTGHLLLSTLHTNDAVSAVTRLGDLRVEPNMITSSLLGVLSQRLVREVCAACRHEYQPPAPLIREFFDRPPAGQRWYRGRGCAACSFTGYKGRLAVAELWVPSEDDVLLINKGAPFDEIRESSRQSTLTMADDVGEKLRAGRTNLEELIRTLPYSCIAQFRRGALPAPPGA
jgi:type IV pilus assembly protein PilB